MRLALSLIVMLALGSSAESMANAATPLAERVASAAIETYSPPYGSREAFEAKLLEHLYEPWYSRRQSEARAGAARRLCDLANPVCARTVRRIITPDVDRIATNLNALVHGALRQSLAGKTDEELEAELASVSLSPIGFRERETRAYAGRLVEGAVTQIMSVIERRVRPDIEKATADLPRAPLPAVPQPPRIP